MAVKKCAKCGVKDYIMEGDVCNHCREAAPEKAPEEKAGPFEGYEFIAIGPCCWGWGKDAKAACLMAAKHGKPDQGFVVWFAHRKTTDVHEVDGSLMWRKGTPPVKVGHVTPMVSHFVLEGVPVLVEGVGYGRRVESGYTCECSSDAFVFDLKEDGGRKAAKCVRCGREHTIGIRPLSDGEEYEWAYPAEEEEEADAT